MNLHASKLSLILVLDIIINYLTELRYEEKNKLLSTGEGLIFTKGGVSL